MRGRERWVRKGKRETEVACLISACLQAHPADIAHFRFTDIGTKKRKSKKKIPSLSGKIQKMNTGH